jgi:hypothetical protein
MAGRTNRPSVPEFYTFPVNKKSKMDEDEHPGNGSSG